MINLYFVCLGITIFVIVIISLFLTLGKKQTDNYIQTEYDTIKRCDCETYKELDVERLETIVESSRIFNIHAYPDDVKISKCHKV